MSDDRDDLLRRIDAAVSNLTTNVARIEAEQTRLRGQLNDKLDTILEKLTGQEADAEIMRGHIIFGMESHQLLSRRVSRMEAELRKLQGDRS